MPDGVQVPVGSKHLPPCAPVPQLRVGQDLALMGMFVGILCF